LKRQQRLKRESWIIRSLERLRHRPKSRPLKHVKATTAAKKAEKASKKALKLSKST
jgi:hypothetical protein